MNTKYSTCLGLLAAIAAIGIPATAAADDLTKVVEENLAALGYDTGPVDGEETMETVIAISKFQAENDMDVTGEVTPQLAGILAAEASGQDSGPDAAGYTAAVPAGAEDQAALQQAQQACLQQKIAEAEEAKKKKKGFGKLLGAVARTTARYATGDFASDVATASREAYKADATAKDMADAAEALGLSEDDIAACQNPV